MRSVPDDIATLAALGLYEITSLSGLQEQQQEAKLQEQLLELLDRIRCGQARDLSALH